MKKVLILTVLTIALFFGCAHTGQVSMQYGNPPEDSISKAEEKLDFLNQQIKLLEKAPKVNKKEIESLKRIKARVNVHATITSSSPTDKERLSEGISFTGKGNSGEVKDLAQAYATMRQADAEAAMMKGLEEGKIRRSSSPVSIAVVNYDFNKTAYVYHPELGSKKKLSPSGGYTIFHLTRLPSMIPIYAEKGELIGNMRPEPKDEKTIFRGVEVDLVLFITAL